MEERKIMEKLSEEEKVLGISLRTKHIKILHAIYSKGEGHAEKNFWFRNMPQCNHCKKFGHVEKNCRNKNRRKEPTASHRLALQPEKEERSLAILSYLPFSVLLPLAFPSLSSPLSFSLHSFFWSVV